MEALSYKKGLGRMNLPSLLNGNGYGTGSQYGIKYENYYALEAWFSKPFAISFPLDISKISIDSGENTTHFGETV